MRQVPVACTRYIDDVTDLVRQSVANVTLRHQRWRRNSTSVSGLVSAVVEWTVAEAERRVRKYVDALDWQYRRRSDPVMIGRRRYRRRVADSAWLLYARSLFNRSVALSSITTSSSSSSSTSSSSSAAEDGGDDVTRFLEQMMSVHSAIHHRRWFNSDHLQRSVVSAFYRATHRAL